jgi:REP element-mobilizing transposase RayT
MARQLRLQFPGAILHLTSRGIERRDIVADDHDRLLLLRLLGEATERFRWITYQYVLMTNHYHLLVQLTEEGSLSRGMHWLNSRYAEMFNRRHRRVGHLLQGRFHARLIEKETYLLEVMRYVVLNPVRAQMVVFPEQYAWSSHRATAGLCAAPSWLAVDQTLSCFAPSRGIARMHYKRFVDDAIGRERCPWKDVVAQMYLGTATWIECMREQVESRPRSDDHPIAQKEPLEQTMTGVLTAVAKVVATPVDRIRYGRGGQARMLAAWLACHEGRLGLRAIAAGLRVRSTGGVSKLIRCCEEQLRSNVELQAHADRCAAALRSV